MRPRRPAASGGAALRALLASALVATGCARGGPGGEAVLLVTIDTLRSDRLGCTGDPVARTPNLDRVARRGTQWACALSAVPLTLPAHASILTGRTPPEHGARDNGLYRVGEEVPLVAEAFRRAGWRTAAFLAAYPLAERFGLARGFDEYRDVEGVRATGSASPFVERAAHHVNADVADWLATRPRDGKPVFLWVHYFDPHAPYAAPRVWNRSARGDPYRAEVAFTDDRTGRLLERLRDEFGGVRVVITADHGESLGDHDEDTHGVFVYEATTRVPLVAAGAGVAAGRLRREPVAVTRVACTLLAMAGIDGHDLPGRPLDEGGADVDPIYVESLYGRLRHGWAPVRALRTERWKVIQAPRPEIYDLAADPGERVNLFDSAPPEAVALLDSLVDTPFPVTPPGDAIDAEVDEALASLGYASARGAPDADAGTEDRPDPKDRVAIERLLGRAAAFLERGDLAVARRALGEAAAIDPRSKEAAVLRARVEAATGAFDRARAVLEECLAWPPASTNALVQYAAGQIELEAGKPLAAEARFAESIRLDPLNVDARYNHGLAAYRLGRYETAVERWKEVLRMDPGHSLAKEWIPQAEKLAREGAP